MDASHPIVMTDGFVLDYVYKIPWWANDENALYDIITADNPEYIVSIVKHSTHHQYKDTVQDTSLQLPD